MSLPFRAVPLFAGLALAPFMASAQEAPPSFGASIDVRVVNVEAVVTDRHGHRVSGLKPGDFRLRVDGKEVPIEYFSEVRDGEAQAQAAPAGPMAPSDQAASPAAAVQELAEGKVGTYYLVFVDDDFSVPRQRNDVLKAIRADLGRLAPEDRMAIVSYGGRRLEMISNWSGSREDLARALDREMARAPYGLDRLTEHKSYVRDAGTVGQFGGDSSTLLAPQSSSDLSLSYEKQLARQLAGGVQAAVSAMRAFAAPRGRKVMLLLSGGWPFDVHTYVEGPLAMPTKRVPTGEELYGPLARTANLLGYTLYPADVPGLQTAAADIDAPAPLFYTAPSGSHKPLSPTAAGPDSDDAPPVAGQTFSDYQEQEIEFSLGFLAKETGGRALYNGNRMLALAATRDDTRSFYWLGFSPAWRRDDKVHSVKLEVRRPGLKVRSRSGFLDLSRQAEATMAVESTLLFGKPPGTLAMPIQVGAVSRPRRGEVEIPVTLGLPVDLMTVVPDGTKYDVRLELRFAASDSAGNTTDVPPMTVNLSADRPPTPGKLVRYATKVHLRGGKARHITVAAYDPLSGKIAMAEADIQAP